MERPGKIFAIILTVLFVCWISLLFLNEPLRFYKEQNISRSENRALARKPFVNLSLLDPYPKAYETYFNDHFLFRPQLVRFNTLTNYFLFDKSPSSEDVTIGKDGWLYLGQKGKKVFTGKFMLSKEQIQGIAEELKNRTLLLEQMGIKFYVVFAPLKEDIYPEFLPASHAHCPTGTVTEKTIEVIRKTVGINFIELEKPLLEARKYGRLYNKTDNHWNRLGAYYAYREIAKRVRKDFPLVRMVENSALSFHEKIIPSGNLAIMADLSDYMKEVDIVPYMNNPRAKPGKKGGIKPPPGVPDGHFEMVRETGDATLPKALLIRDSFTDALMPFLDETFQRTVYIFDDWHYDFNRVVVENEKPDLVILVMYEPNISVLIHIM
jgi:alginate O-acetyltransferase complex protein AlgJ